MIKITKEINLQDFNTWAGATDTVKYLTSDELDQVEQLVIELLGSEEFGIGETQLNDFLWFERDMIAEALGFRDFDELMTSREEGI